MWARILTIGAGLWLMIAPSVLGYSGAAAHINRITGPLASTFALIAMWEATRAMRWAVLPITLGTLLAPLLFEHSSVATVSNVLTAMIMAVCSFVKGKRQHQFGGGWRALWHPSELSR
jgi:hypothetical protein